MKNASFILWKKHNGPNSILTMCSKSSSNTSSFVKSCSHIKYKHFHFYTLKLYRKAYVLIYKVYILYLGK